MKNKIYLLLMTLMIVISSCKVQESSEKNTRNYETYLDKDSDDNNQHAVKEIKEDVLQIESVIDGNKYYTNSESQVDAFFEVLNSINLNIIRDESFSIGQSEYEIMLSYNNSDKTEIIKIGCGYISFRNKYYYLDEEEFDRVKNLILTWDYSKVVVNNSINKMDEKKIKSIMYINDTFEKIIDSDIYGKIVDELKTTEYIEVDEEELDT